jgi:hypothetical protein
MGLVSRYACEKCNRTLDSEDCLLQGDIVSATPPSEGKSRTATTRKVLVPEGSYCKTCLVDAITGRYSGPERGGPGDR